MLHGDFSCNKRVVSLVIDSGPGASLLRPVNRELMVLIIVSLPFGERIQFTSASSLLFYHVTLIWKQIWEWFSEATK